MPAAEQRWLRAHGEDDPAERQRDARQRAKATRLPATDATVVEPWRHQVGVDALEARVAGRRRGRCRGSRWPLDRSTSATWTPRLPRRAARAAGRTLASDSRSARCRAAPRRRRARARSSRRPTGRCRPSGRAARRATWPMGVPSVARKKALPARRVTARRREWPRRARRGRAGDHRGRSRRHRPDEARLARSSEPRASSHARACVGPPARNPVAERRVAGQQPQREPRAVEQPADRTGLAIGLQREPLIETCARLDLIGDRERDADQREQQAREEGDGGGVAHAVSRPEADGLAIGTGPPAANPREGERLGRSD